MNEKTDDARTTRGEYKTQGGKLVGVTLLWNNSTKDDATGRTITVAGARIDGDFFTDAADGEVTATPLFTTLGVIIANWLNTHTADDHSTEDTVDALTEIIDAVISSLPTPPALVGTSARAIATAALRAYKGDDAPSFRCA